MNEMTENRLQPRVKSRLSKAHRRNETCWYEEVALLLRNGDAMPLPAYAPLLEKHRKVHTSDICWVGYHQFAVVCPALLLVLKAALVTSAKRVCVCSRVLSIGLQAFSWRLCAPSCASIRFKVQRCNTASMPNHASSEDSTFTALQSRGPWHTDISNNGRVLFQRWISVLGISG